MSQVMGIPTEEYSIGQGAKTSPIVLFFFVRSTHRAVNPGMLRENLVEICGTFHAAPSFSDHGGPQQAWIPVLVAPAESWDVHPT
jgi:hypothetical protein